MTGVAVGRCLAAELQHCAADLILPPPRVIQQLLNAVTVWISDGSRAALLVFVQVISQFPAVGAVGHNRIAHSEFMFYHPTGQRYLLIQIINQQRGGCAGTAGINAFNQFTVRAVAETGGFSALSDQAWHIKGGIGIAALTVVGDIAVGIMAITLSQAEITGQGKRLVTQCRLS